MAHGGAGAVGEGRRAAGTHWLLDGSCPAA